MCASPIKTSVSVLKKYKDIEGVVKMEEVNGEELVKKFAEEMEQMLGRKMKSVKVRVRLSVKAHQHQKKNRFNHSISISL